MSDLVDLRKEVASRVELLVEFRNDLAAWFNSDDAESDALRTRINRSIRAVRDILQETGCLKSIVIAPPPAIGGPVQRVDPLASVFQSFYGMSLIPNIIDMVEECIGVVESPAYLEKLALGSAGSETTGAEHARGLQRLLHVCGRFPRVARQLQERHDGRSAHTVEDEYDVQDLMHALLRIDFDDVRAEEWSPSYAAGASRIDFLLKRERIVLEIKKTRPSLKARELADQLMVDIARYARHPDCEALVCFVYDPELRIGNPAALEDDLSGTREGRDVRVIIAPTA